MKANNKVVTFLAKKGFDVGKVWFKDLALAVTIVSKDGTDVSHVYEAIAKQTGQTLNTVTFHFSRANKFRVAAMNGDHNISPKLMVFDLAQEFNNTTNHNIL